MTKGNLVCSDGSYKKCELLPYRFCLPFLNNQKVSRGQRKSSTQEFYFLTGCLHDVVDLAVHVSGVLATLVGVEGEDVSTANCNALLGFISGTSEI